MHPLTPYLDDLEKRIDPFVEDDLFDQWKNFLDDKLGSGIFLPKRQQSVSPSITWPKVSVNAALEHFDAMVLHQLAQCSDSLANGTGQALNVRANYGVGILPSVFGAGIFVMDDKMNTLPTSLPLEGGADAIRTRLDQGAPDLRNGYGGRTLDTGKYYVDLFAGYPKISRYVQIYHPDLQGPMDVCELLWGSDIFVDLYDEPELVHALLGLITTTYSRFMHEWYNLIPSRDDYSAHWGLWHKGRLLIRNDSAMNLSPEMFETFILPYDQRLLREFGGGVVHFCGKGDHFINKLAQYDGLYAINLTQPEYNDMELIYRETIDRGIMLIGLPLDAAKAATRDLRGRVHGQ